MNSTVVLHHGLGGFNFLEMGLCRVHYWRRIDKAIAERGYSLLVTSVHPTAAIDRRAVQLKEQILEHLESAGRPNERAVIIAHSFGGMDARYMISRLGMADRIAALITISTGHRGSSYVTWLIRTFDSFGHLRVFSAAVQDISSLWEAMPDYCSRFNKEVPDVPGVRYFSITAACPPDRVPPPLWHSYSIVADTEGENDGHVSVQSARWGEHLETWPVEHYHQINWPLGMLPGESTEDITPRYMALLDRLVEERLLSRQMSNV